MSKVIGIDLGTTNSCVAVMDAGQDKVNPGSIILSAEMMLRHMGWIEAADLIISSMESAITDKMVTYDFERLMDDANLVSCSGFAKEIIKRM